MFGSGLRRRRQKTQDRLDKLFTSGRGKAAGSYDEMYRQLKEIFEDNDPTNFCDLRVGDADAARVCLISCDGLVDSALIDNHLLRPLMEMDADGMQKLHANADALLSGVFQMLSAKNR